MAYDIFLILLSLKKSGKSGKADKKRNNLKTINENPNTLAQLSSSSDKPINKMNIKVSNRFLLK